MSYKILYDSVQTVLKDYPDVLQHWENTFRETIASTDVKVLLSGYIPDHLIKHAISTANESASKFCSDKALTASNRVALNTLAAQLWNPITSTLIHEMPSSSSASKGFASTERKASKKTGASRSEMRNKTDIIPEVPDSAKVKSIPPFNADITYPELEHYLKTNLVLYHHVRYMKCTEPNCQQCLQMFTQLNLTPCLGHRRCVPSGWFPHVGVHLWHTYKYAHDQRRLIVNPKPTTGVRQASLSSWRREEESSSTISRSASPMSVAQSLDEEVLLNSPQKRKSPKRAQSLPPLQEVACQPDKNTSQSWADIVQSELE